MKRVAFAGLSLALALSLVACGSQGETKPESPTETTESKAETSISSVAPAEPAAPAESSSEEKEADKVPAEYESALSQAKNYSDIMHMSKQKIFEQLASEYGGKFTEEAATYAVEHLEADYKQNALEKAKGYQDEMHMSPAAIKDQLISEHGEAFTEEEAQYAIDNLPK